MKPLLSVNPFTNQVIKEYKQHTDKEVEERIILLQNNYNYWSKTVLHERSQFLEKVSQKLEEHKQELAKLMTLEMGKPISQSVAEVEKCMWVCNYFAQEGANFLERKNIQTEASESYVLYEPLGILLCIMPWNFPLWQFFRVFAPNVLLGNVILLKHASNVSGCSLMIDRIIEEANPTMKVMRSVLVSSDRVKNIIEHKHIKAVTLTGSEAAGRSVAAVAGAQLKKTVMELGGSNACIVFDDADLDRYVDEIVWSRFQNNGQSCIASKRFLVQQGIYNQFKERLLQKVKALVIENPMLEQTKLGPMASVALAIELENQLSESVSNGAKVLLGGKRKDAHFEATVVESSNLNVSIFEEETFGPLLALTPFNTIEEAIEISNASKYGLGASVYTQNKEIAQTMTHALHEGAVFINGMVKSDPRLPFGGIKNSGYGRELSSYALLEFANIKTIWKR